MTDEITTFVVTDIEADGPNPRRSSMLSFASVACDVRGEVLGEFEAVLEPRPDRQPDETTMAWWATQPAAWKAATEGAEPAETVMPRYADWVESLPGQRVFAAAPMIFDGLWMDEYLDTFAGTRVLGGPFKTRQIFRGGGVCLYTMAGTLRGAPYLKWGMQRVPTEWYGNIVHTHKAIDDARGFANVLAKLFELSGELDYVEAAESNYR
ncbi:MAG TPA: 3'-5' exoribonuclease [Devosiaceae bacterium]|nr:3'-5' exoribonuclease [Devosiaceae bacterium]